MIVYANLLFRFVFEVGGLRYEKLWKKRKQTKNSLYDWTGNVLSSASSSLLHWNAAKMFSSSMTI